MPARNLSQSPRPPREAARHERISWMVETVGGLGRAAEIAEAHPDTVNKWRKPDAKLPLEGMLALAIEAGVTLDWVATGFDIRPDLAIPAPGMMGTLPGLPAGMARVLPLRARTERVGEVQLTQLAPSEFALDTAWAQQEFGVAWEDLRYARLDDDGMQPILRLGGTVIVDTRPADARHGLYLVELGRDLVARRVSMLPGAVRFSADAVPNFTFEVANDRELPPMYPILFEAQRLG